MTVVGDIRSAARGGNTGSPPLMGSITATGLATIRQRHDLPKILQQDWSQLDSAMICQQKYCNRIGQYPNNEEENRFIHTYGATNYMIIRIYAVGK
jgi:hypothetical protein